MQLGFSSCRKLAVCLSIVLQLVVLGLLDYFFVGYRLMIIGWESIRCEIVADHACSSRQAAR
jgi:hypothetical protein